MRKNPKVSVLIPSYNSALFLDETIQSVLNQTFQDYELIIIDDCSSDNTDEVVQKYLHNEKIQYHKNEQNLGLAGNWNKALAYAKGDYIKFLMSDDKFHPDLLKKFVDVMDQHPGVSLVTSYREQFGAETEMNAPEFTHLQKGEKIIYETLKDRNWIGEPTCVMFRRSNLWLGDFNPEFLYYIDWEMWIRHLSIGDCYIIPETLSYFRVHEKQVSRMVMKNMLHYCETYHFYKRVKKLKSSIVDFSEIDIDGLIKEKAADCIKGVLKLLPRLHKKENRILFNKVLKIIQMEKVPLSLYFKAINNSSMFRKMAIS
jgi:glycosyltransferase involved in cell wall biosynthesis